MVGSGAVEVCRRPFGVHTRSPVLDVPGDEHRVLRANVIDFHVCRDVVWVDDSVLELGNRPVRIEDPENQALETV